MGIAVLGGIIASISEKSSTEAPSEGITPSQIPSRFIACVRRPQSAERITSTLGKYPVPLTVLRNENIKGVEAADVIMLGCKPWMVNDVLDVPGMREALKGKLLISILAGTKAHQIEEVLYKDHPEYPVEDRCRVVRVMPNTAAIVRESMTVIEACTPPLSPTSEALINWMFTRCGKVATLPASVMDASTSLAGSGPALVALMLEALADGAVAMGLPRVEAQMMAAQVMRGTTSMVQSGEHPALIREKTSTPGGCTIGGLLVLEEGRVRGSIARAVREATVVASQLGKGVQGVNGTRF